MPAYNTVSDTDSLEGLAKEIYPVKEIKDMEQRFVKFKQEVAEDTKLTFSPKNDGSFVFPVKVSGPHGQKMINQKERLPYGKPSNIEQGSASIKEYAGVIEFTKRELELAKGNAAVFSEAKTMEMEGLIENAHKYFNRQIANGDGSGVMTLVQGTQAIGQTVIEVDDATPFQIGMVLDQFDSTGATKENADLVVADIDILSSPNTITIETAIATAMSDNGEIYLAGVNDNAAADGKEMIGLPLVVDDGTLNVNFQGIVRSGAGAVSNYRGITVDAANAPMSVALVAQLMSRAYRVGGIDFNGMDDCYWLLSPEQWRVYAALSIPQIRFVATDSPDLAGVYGKKGGYEIAGKRAVVDTDVSRTKAYLIRKDAIKMAVACPLDWESDLGGTTLKWLSGYPQGIMLLYALQQFFSESPREVVALENLASVAI